MELERQSPEIDPAIADLLTDSELALALHEIEVARLSNRSPEQSKPATSSTHSPADPVYDELEEAGEVKECEVCCEEKHTDLYPHKTAACDCKCLSEVCLVCIQQHIKSQTESKEWKEGSLTCPICNRSLLPQEIEEYADGDTLKTHLSHMIDQTVKDMPGFTRCPNPDCNSGQVHEGGESHPFVTCAVCNTQFCFRHGIPTQQAQPQSPSAQHENMSCDEYDLYLADPLRFRSEHQRQQECADVERRELEAVARARERMDGILQQRRADVAAATAAADESRVMPPGRVMPRGRTAPAVLPSGRLVPPRREMPSGTMRRRMEEQAAAREERERRDREEREERARIEEKQYEEERARAEAERRANADEILRRKAEDEQSEWLIGVSTKGCPRCAKRIEKNEGCMHMTCPCGCEFCWECTGPWVNNSCPNCFGGPVVQYQ